MLHSAEVFLFFIIVKLALYKKKRGRGITSIMKYIENKNSSIIYY